MNPQPIREARSLLAQIYPDLSPDACLVLTVNNPALMPGGGKPVPLNYHLAQDEDGQRVLLAGRVTFGGKEYVFYCEA
jgi:hypothetical protein